MLLNRYYHKYNDMGYFQACRYHALNLFDGYRRRIIYNIKYQNTYPEPYEILTVDPDEIERMVIPRFQSDHYDRGTHVIGGDWDTKTIDETFVSTWEVQKKYTRRVNAPIHKYGLYNAMYKLLKTDTQWEETNYYQYKIQQGTNQSRLIREKENIEQLSRRIRDGYKSQEELSPDTPPFTRPEYDEVKINIDRNGGLLFDDGRHRLILAKILDIEKIPVRVFVRHECWQELQ